MSENLKSPHAMSKDVNNMLMQMHYASPVLIAMFDANDVLRYANPAFCDAYHTQPDGIATWSDIMRANFLDGVGARIVTDNIDAWLATTTSRRGKQKYRAFEADLCDGRWLFVAETLNEQGWMMFVAQEITHLRQDSRTLRQAQFVALRASQTDPLTGISNRRHVLGLLENSLLTLKDDHSPLCVAILDLDRFKTINDQYGHTVGDQILCDFAQHLLKSTRRQDGIGRIGGEEFLLLLPSTLEQAQDVVQRLMHNVRLARPMKDLPKLSYTTSIGLVEVKADETTMHVLKRADDALYAAKNAGRDCVQTS